MSGGVDLVGLRGSRRRGQHPDIALFVVDKEGLQQALVEQVSRRDGVNDRVDRVEPQHHGHVAELEVEVENDHGLFRLTCQRRGQVHRDHGLADAAFRREDHRHPTPLFTGRRCAADGFGCCSGGCCCSAHLVVQLQQQVGDSLGQLALDIAERDRVVDAGAERQAEHLGGGLGNNHDGAGPRPVPQQRADLVEHVLPHLGRPEHQHYDPAILIAAQVELVEAREAVSAERLR